jgi:hypothetical protein
MEQLTVGAGADFVNNSRFQVDEDTSRDMFARTGFREEGIEGIITSSDGLVTWHLTIGLDAVLQAEQFPAGVSDLNTALTDMDTDCFTHC